MRVCYGEEKRSVHPAAASAALHLSLPFNICQLHAFGCLQKYKRTFHGNLLYLSAGNNRTERPMANRTRVCHKTRSYGLLWLISLCSDKNIHLENGGKRKRETDKRKKFTTKSSSSHHSMVWAYRSRSLFLSLFSVHLYAEVLQIGECHSYTIYDRIEM